MRHSSTVETVRLREALARGAEALLQRQSSDGSWHDFWLPGGSSDEWVTAYTGAAIATLPFVRTKSAARAAWNFLVSRAQERCGWGYSHAAPADADSIAWALILARRVGGEYDPEATAAQAMLRSFVSDRGASTYASGAEIRRFTNVAEDVSFAGWVQPHWCVGGAAAQVPQFASQMHDPVIRSQRPDGSWKSYWWTQDAYATAMCAAALAGAEARDAIARAARWAHSRAISPGTPFETALLLRIFYTAGDSAAAASCAERLVDVQEFDGTWRGSAWLRVPAPDIIDPETVAVYERWWGIPPDGRTAAACNFQSLDQRSIFTTATALSAAAAFMNVCGS